MQSRHTLCHALLINLSALYLPPMPIGFVYEILSIKYRVVAAMDKTTHAPLAPVLSYVPKFSVQQSTDGARNYRVSCIIYIISFAVRVILLALG